MLTHGQSGLHFEESFEKEPICIAHTVMLCNSLALVKGKEALHPFLVVKFGRAQVIINQKMLAGVAYP